MQLPLQKALKNGIVIQLDWMRPQEKESVRVLLNTVITEGKTYPQEQPLSEAEFVAYWLSQDAFVVRAIANNEAQSQSGILGAFYLKPNFPGRCSHICNAGFIVQPALRGQGIGRWMGEEMLRIASSLGYAAVMFNLVFETNIPSINLWQSLGFEIIGRIPEAVKLPEGRLIAALIMYRNLP